MNIYDFNGLCIDVCLHGDIRLIPTESSPLPEALGQVEVCLNGVWSCICGSEWTNEEATVACRQLGYASSGMVTRVHYIIIQDNRVGLILVQCMYIGI